MNELFSTIDKWIGEDRNIALITVVSTWGSAPRGVGAKMVVNAEGEMAGSVSGGCIEGAVVEVAMEVIDSGIPQLLHFGVTDATAWDVGLACGGEIEVFVRPLDRRIYQAARKGLEKEMESKMCVVISEEEGFLGIEVLLQDGSKLVSEYAHSHPGILDEFNRVGIEQKQSARKTISLSDDIEIEVFIDVLTPPPSLVIIGGVHIAIPLVAIAKEVGFRTIVLDPRRKFGSLERFGHADIVINSWPQKALDELNLNYSTAIAVLSHDPKIDDPALEIVLTYPVFYVGALGSKKTQEERRKRLIKSGLTEDQVNRIKGPIGLNLGSRSPEEIALAIMAEIIKDKNCS
jgi:xanthine dehydrogenase accessory factor